MKDLDTNSRLVSVRRPDDDEDHCLASVSASAETAMPGE